MFSHNLHLIDLYLFEHYFKDLQQGTFLDINEHSISLLFEQQLHWNGYILESNKQQILNLLNRNNDIKYISLSNSNSINYINNDIIQKFTYNELIHKHINLCIIDITNIQLLTLQEINSAIYAPDILVVKYSLFQYNEIKKILSNYNLKDNIAQQYLIFQKRKTILLITRCTRINNLSIIKQSINNTFNNSNIDFIWYIIVEQKKVSKLEFNSIYNKIKESNIILRYISSTGHYLFSGQFLNLAFFDSNIKFDYSYILDDDNILSPNFIPILTPLIYKNYECIVINLYNFLGDIQPFINSNCRGKIDCANFIIRYDILKNLRGYDLTPNFVTKLEEKWAEDALTFKKLLDNNIKIFYSHQFCAYYNGISINKKS